MTERAIELLAPARDLACGLAAVDHGADAVYIGGPMFGARAAAGNSLADIERLVRHAHLFRSRVYVALNTLFTDAELEQAVHLSHQLYETGVDALIIQDMGLLECDLPPLPLHSSTQMNNRTPEKVQFLEKTGFTQVVLARELSLAQIRAIRARTSVTLECFVHGALCVCYSGQCYISEVMAGRSANRGACAQLCRHRYDLRDARGNTIKAQRYLLSLKDLDLSAHLTTLIDAGVRSLKIEGRLKDSHYVKNITAYYRTCLDRILAQRDDVLPASSGHCQFTFVPDPARSFNRGTTDAYLRETGTAMAELRTPKSLGLPVGKVRAVAQGSFVLDGNKPLHNGDGLCFFDHGETLVGLRVNRVEGDRIYTRDRLEPLGLTAGTGLYRNHDVAFNDQLDQSRNCRTINVYLTLKDTEDGLQLLVDDEDGIKSVTTLQLAWERSRSSGDNVVLAARQLRKSGGTPYTVASIQVATDPVRFTPASTLNELRRQALERHSDIRISSYLREFSALVPNTSPWIQAKVDYRDNITNSKAKAFFQRHGVHVEQQPLSALQTPDCVLMTSKYCIRRELGICLREGGGEKVAESLFLADLTGTYALHFHCDVCEMSITRHKPANTVPQHIQLKHNKGKQRA